MALRRPAAFVALAVLALAALGATACGGGGETVAAAECFLPQDGRIVGASGNDCAPPAGATVEPTPTFTPVPAGGGIAGGAGLIIANGCATCHTLASVPQAQATVGPDLTGIGAKGADFIRESIVDPSATITEGYEDGLMPVDFADTIPAADLDALVDFLATQ